LQTFSDEARWLFALSGQVIADRLYFVGVQLAHVLVLMVNVPVLSAEDVGHRHDVRPFWLAAAARLVELVRRDGHLRNDVTVVSVFQRQNLVGVRVCAGIRLG